MQKKLIEKKKILRKIYLIKQKYNSKLPRFLRYHWDRYYRLERQETWRRPRGRDNKSRLRIKGYPPVVDPGYRKPRFVRYLHPSGLKPIVVSSITDLEKIKEKKDEVIVYISGSVGLKKRMEILNKANEFGIKVANG